ncbi:MAG: hypothetical protein LBB11_03405 [Puniceicoccales bacterium]|nr:hypothetical protein [Puniceicoccales bacterium]
MKWVIIGDGILWDPQAILTLPNDAYFTGNALFLCDAKTSSWPVQAIPFSIYDGFAIKNILAHTLKIPSALITQFSDLHGIVQRRCRDLQIPFCYTEVPHRCSFIRQFGHEHHCTIRDMIIFDRNLTPYNFSKASPSFLVSPHTFPGNPQHCIRSFINTCTDRNSQVLPYAYEARTFDLSCPKRVQTAAQEIRTLICDIDGTCTDGFKIYAEDGSQWKRFSMVDVQALKNWRNSGRNVFVISGENNLIPQKFAQYCDIPPQNVYGNAGDQKLAILAQICQEHQFQYSEIAYIGDDVNDLAVIEHLIAENGTAACPPNAMPLIKGMPNIRQLNTPGGYGAIAEFLDLL